MAGKYINRAATRTPVCFCLDVSGSVSTSMDVLNGHVAGLYRTIADNSNPMVVFDIATITFGGMLGSKKNYMQTTGFSELTQDNSPPRFESDERTLIGKAVNEALDLLEHYKEIIKRKREGFNYYQPILIIITDGQTTDKEDAERLERVQQKIRRLAFEEKLIIVPIGIGRINPDVMNKFSPDGKYFRSSKIDFSHIIKFLVSTALSGTNELSGSGIKRAIEMMRTTSKEDLK